MIDDSDNLVMVFKSFIKQRCQTFSGPGCLKDLSLIAVLCGCKSDIFGCDLLVGQNKKFEDITSKKI